MSKFSSFQKSRFNQKLISIQLRPWPCIEFITFYKISEITIFPIFNLWNQITKNKIIIKVKKCKKNSTYRNRILELRNK